MSEGSMKRQEPSEKNIKKKTVRNQESSLQHKDTMAHLQKSADTESLLKEVERFSHLNSDMKDCLLSMIQKTKDVVGALCFVQKAVEKKKKELNYLNDMEASAAELERLAGEHRIQTEKFDGYMKDQRRQWAEEKKLREKEETVYRENLKRSRQEEKKEHKHKLAEEKSTLREKMKEELHGILRQVREEQKEMEEGLDRRERALKKREEECSRLVQELDLLMTKLAVQKRMDNRDVFSSDTVSPKMTTFANRWYASDDAPSVQKVDDGPPLPGVREDPNEYENPPIMSVREKLLQESPVGAIQANQNENRDSPPSGKSS